MLLSQSVDEEMKALGGARTGSVVGGRAETGIPDVHELIILWHRLGYLGYQA